MPDTSTLAPEPLPGGASSALPPRARRAADRARPNAPGP